VLLLEPLETRNEGVLVLPTEILIGPAVWPCATLTVPPDRFVLNEKLMVVAVTCKLVLVGLDVSPEVPMTVIDAVPPAILGAVWIVNCVVPLALLTVVGLKVQVAPVGRPEQLKLTVPLNPFWGDTVIVEVALSPAGMLDGLGALAATSNVTRTEVQAFASFVTSGEPKPVTWSYPTPALKPISVVPDGQFGVPEVQGTILLPVVTSWNAEGVLAAREYSVGLTGANPVVPELPTNWLIKARIAVKVGAAAEVPPTAVRSPPVPVRNPAVQVWTRVLLGPSSEQIR
jgi:hypothetical protein